MHEIKKMINKIRLNQLIKNNIDTIEEIFNTEYYDVPLYELEDLFIAASENRYINAKQTAFYCKLFNKRALFSSGMIKGFLGVC